VRRHLLLLGHQFHDLHAEVGESGLERLDPLLRRLSELAVVELGAGIAARRLQEQARMSLGEVQGALVPDPL
jgi:hypothetical protein